MPRTKRIMLSVLQHNACFQSFTISFYLESLRSSERGTNIHMYINRFLRLLRRLLRNMPWIPEGHWARLGRAQIAGFQCPAIQNRSKLVITTG